MRQMIKNRPYLLITLGAILCILACVISFIFQLHDIKHKFRHDLTSHIRQFIYQQQEMLQRLGKNLLIPIQQHDLATISAGLTAYEEILFSMSKQNLAIPVSIYLVSFDAPQQIVGSFGKLDDAVLAPDANYYTQIVEEPDQLAISKLYIKQAMPDYKFINLGLGIVNGNNYHGHLDIKLSVTALHQFIAQKLDPKFGLYGFNFTDNKLLAPDIYLLYPACILAGIAYILIRMLIIVLSALGLVAIYKFYRKYSKLSMDLKRATEESKILTTKNIGLQNAVAVQDTYGLLAAKTSSEIQIIDLAQLLADVKAVNYMFALERGIVLSFPAYEENRLRFYGCKLRLMQILSGVLYEIIWQLKTASVVRLQVNYSDDHQGQQKIEFQFQDDGFYAKLQDRVVETSMADIRCKGWENICALIDQEMGHLEHIHTAYVGNTINITIHRKIVNNVIALESYFSN